MNLRMLAMMLTFYVMGFGDARRSRLSGKLIISLLQFCQYLVAVHGVAQIDLALGDFSPYTKR